MSKETFTGSTYMIVEECCECHMLFAMTKDFYNECYDNRPNKSFCCPKGHSMHYTGISDVKRLKEQLSNVQSCCDRYRTKVDELEEKIPRIRGGYRSQLKRAKCKP